MESVQFRKKDFSIGSKMKIPIYFVCRKQKLILISLMMY